MALVRLSEGAIQHKPQKPTFGSGRAVKCGREEGPSVQARAECNLGWLS